MRSLPSRLARPSSGNREEDYQLFSDFTTSAGLVIVPSDRAKELPKVKFPYKERQVITSTPGLSSLSPVSAEVQAFSSSFSLTKNPASC
jgi:hypothetical protein